MAHPIPNMYVLIEFGFYRRDCVGGKQNQDLNVSRVKGLNHLPKMLHIWKLFQSEGNMAQTNGRVECQGQCQNYLIQSTIKIDSIEDRTPTLFL